MPRDSTTNDSSVEAKPADALALFDHGYTRLIPLLPFDARDENGALLKDAGKAPAQKIGDSWILLSGWQKRGAATREDVEGHLSDGANIGHVLGDLIALDIDDDDPERQDAVLAIIAGELDRDPKALTVRTNNRPMVLVRLADGSPPITKHSLEISNADDGKTFAKFEVLGEGQQAVVAGTNAVGKPIRITNLVPFTDLPEVSPEQCDELGDAIGRYYRDQGFTVSGGGGGGNSGPPPEQEGLQAPDGARSVVDLMTDGAGAISIPNTIASRDKWLAIAAAMKASCRSLGEWASLERVFVNWTRVRHPNDRPEDILKQWHSLKPPFRNGWTFLQDTLDRAGLGARVFSPIDGFEPGLPPLAAPPRGLILRYAPDFSLDNVPPQLVQGLLAQEQVALLYGPPNVGKSFVMLHLANCIATGAAFFGRKVRQGSVLYCALEGVGGFEKRVVAYQRQFEPGHNFAALLGHWSAFDDKKVAEVIQAGRDVAAASGDPLRLVIVDTVSKVMAGHEENSNSEVSLFLARMGEIADALGATVLLVHHSGKNVSAGARGGSAFKGNVDTELELVAADTPGVSGTLRASKLRDDDKLAANDHFYFLKPTPLWREDEWGDQMQTAILIEVDAPDTTALSDAALPPRARALLELLVTMTDAAADDGPEIGAFNEALIEKSDLRIAFVSDVLKDAPGTDEATRRKQRVEFNRHLKTLETRDKIEVVVGLRRSEATVRLLRHASQNQTGSPRRDEAHTYRCASSASSVGGECLERKKEVEQPVQINKEGNAAGCELDFLL